VREALRLALAATVVAALSGGPADAGRVKVNPRRATAAGVVSDRFVSFAVDMDQVVGGTFWDPAGGTTEVAVDPYDFGRARLRNLAEALAPAYLRLGGSASDGLWYDMSDDPDPAVPEGFAEVLTKQQWDAASDFAATLGFDLVLTVNAGPGPRTAGGAWQDGNARTFLEYVTGRGDPVRVVEFGNEPNLFGLRAGLTDYSAADYDRDMQTFRALVDQVLPNAGIFAPGNIHTRTLGENVLGNVAFGPRAAEMLALVGTYVEGVEYHYYGAVSTRCPPAGPRVDADTALDAAYLDGIDETAAANDELRASYVPGRPIWMTESGGQSCGGQVGLGDRFLNSFWYLASLGHLARRGHEVFVRQTLSGSTYGLIDDATLEPTPDYWAALLWRRLMGRQALALAKPPKASDVRVFVHCATDGPPGAVTVLALNTSRTRSAKLRIKGIKRKTPADVYLVTAPDPLGRAASLNGATLVADENGVPPAFEPLVTKRRALRLPPISYAFVVVPGAAAPACM